MECCCVPCLWQQVWSPYLQRKDVLSLGVLEPSPQGFLSDEQVKQMAFPFWSWGWGSAEPPGRGSSPGCPQDVPRAVAVPGWLLLLLHKGSSCRAVPDASTRRFFIKTVWTKKGLEVLETSQICGAALAALPLIAALGLPQRSLTFCTSAISIRIFC